MFAPRDPLPAQKESKRVAAFDLDGTLIVPKSGAAFAKNKDDWTWFDAKVPLKLKEMHAKGFVVFKDLVRF